MADNNNAAAINNRRGRLSSAPEQGRGRLFASGKLDLTFLFLTLGILAAGLVMLFSASAPYASYYKGDSYYFIKRQLVFAVVGVAVMLIASKVDYHLLRRFAWPLYALSAVMLVAVLFVPEVVPGFKRWLGVGSFTFQPSEVAKFSLTLLLAHLVAKHYNDVKNAVYDLKLLCLVGAFAALVIAEHHLSATILIVAIGLVVIFTGGMNKKLVIAMLVFAVVAGVALVALAMKYPDKLGYISDRINIWLNVWDFDRDLTYQTRQSLLAIGSGGVTGQGIGQSAQKYLWVPEPQNDFIFAIVCEELGLFGALLIVIAFALLVWRGLVIAMKAPDKFGALLTIGLIFQIGLQTVFNLLVVTNSMPNTGISLPFFSYGGTSLLMLLGQMGIILGVSRQSKVQKA